MGNAGSVDSQQTDFRAHNVPLKLPMPEPGELEERFASVLTRQPEPEELEMKAANPCVYLREFWHAT